MEGEKLLRKVVVTAFLQHTFIWILDIVGNFTFGTNKMLWPDIAAKPPEFQVAPLFHVFYPLGTVINPKSSSLVILS